MRAPLRFAAALVIAGALAPTLAASPRSGVRITMHDGRVSISASDATLKEVLDEWARVGGSTIVSGEAATGTPVSIDLIDVPEGEALSVLLRSVGGYVAVDRGPQSTNISRFERILIMPARAAMASAPVRSAAAQAPQPREIPQPNLPPEFANPGVARILGPDGQPVADDQDGAPPFRPSPRPAGFFPGDEPARPETATPAGMPTGTRVPGIIAPAPPAQPLPAPPPQR